MATYAEQLAAVETAISDLLSGKVQEYTIAGRTVKKLNIDVLFKERDRLAPLANREAESGGGIQVLGGYVLR